MNKIKRRLWRDNETKVLLKSWKDNAYISRLITKGCIKNPLYFAISKDLLKEGCSRSMREVMFRMETLRRNYRSTKLFGRKVSDAKWCEEVEEILKLEKSLHVGGQATDSQIEQGMKLVYGPYIEDNVPEAITTNAVRNNFTDDDSDSDSDLLSYSVIKPSESEVPNNSQVIQVSLPQLSSNNFPKTTENILLKFCREFQRSNRHFEANDAAMLELFKEQNEIFRTQTTLMMKLLLK